ncbi:MAG: putative xanthine dehydrogenase subunit [Gemmataceae bacterium]|nr:putative xanthine dehydrogenase subunit [Gemmataceae bacterium]
MLELRAVLETAERLAARGEDGVLATVVKVEGSTYRRLGARLLVTRAGEWVGGISGGCLEGDLVRKAWWRTESGPAVVTYDSTADDETAWQFGLGCNGVVQVLLERLTPGGVDPLAFPRRWVRRGEPGVLATVVRADPATGAAVGDRLAVAADGGSEGDFHSDELSDLLRIDATECLARDRSRVETYALPGGEVEVFFEVVRPPLRLVVFGAGFDAVPVVRAAKSLGWRVTVVDRRPVFARQPAFTAADEVIVAPPREVCEQLRLTARTAAVVMNHNFPDDRAVLAALLPSVVCYIGVLGPRARTEKLLAEAARDGSDPSADQLARLHAPVGLDIGADTPEEIAVAVIAQIVATVSGHDGGDLRDRPGPIHRREPARVVEAV